LKNVEIKEVEGRKDVISFIKFPFKLYKSNPYYVPPIIDFEISTLSPKKNPAFDNCTAKYYLAFKNGEIVGRIAGIILDQERDDKNLCRFGWLDFIDDQEVSSSLFNAVINWAKAQGIEGIHGPMGFTDLDFEGLLIEGFDYLATQASIYNFPYYKDHLEQLGFAKAVDWLEVRGTVPVKIPRKLTRTCSIISSRFGLVVKKFKSNKQLLKYSGQVFEVLNKSFTEIYGYYPLTKKQIDYYVKQYFGFIKREFVTIVMNKDDHVVGFAISLPSLSKAFQKAKGYLYPFGFIHIFSSAFRAQ